jgi:hypothetical protein
MDPFFGILNAFANNLFGNNQVGENEVDKIKQGVDTFMATAGKMLGNAKPSLDTGILDWFGINPLSGLKDVSFPAPGTPSGTIPLKTIIDLIPMVASISTPVATPRVPWAPKPVSRDVAPKMVKGQELGGDPTKGLPFTQEVPEALPGTQQNQLNDLARAAQEMAKRVPPETPKGPTSPVYPNIFSQSPSTDWATQLTVELGKEVLRRRGVNVPRPFTPTFPLPR